MYKKLESRRSTCPALLVLCLLLVPPHNSHARPFAPESDDAILADWGQALPRRGVDNIQLLLEERDGAMPDPPNLGTENFLGRVRRELKAAVKPGQAYRYEIAQYWLATLGERPHAFSDGLSFPNARRLWQEYFYQKAMVAQYRHEYHEAMEYLTNILDVNPIHVRALIRASSIRLSLGQPKEAQYHCVILVGNSDPLTATICLLGTLQTKEELAPKYKEVKQRIFTRYPNQKNQKGLGITSAWKQRTLAEAATRLGLYNEADRWMAIPLEDASAAYLSQWADIQLARGEYLAIVTRLSNILDGVVKANDMPDDPLLLRLVIALDKSKAPRSSTGPHWRNLLEERMHVRERRRDAEHAADLALFYASLKGDSDKALHWAIVNFEISRTYADWRLLQQARGRSTIDTSGFDK